MIQLARSLLCLGLVAGCARGPAAPAGPATIENVAVAAPAPGRTLQDDLAAMPKETELVFALDMAQLRGSALFKAYEPEIRARMGNDLKELEAMCGFDPMQALDHVMLGMDVPMGADPEHAVVFIRGYEQAATFACLQKAAAKHTGERKTIAIDGGHFELMVGRELEFRGLFVDPTTILFIKHRDGYADKAELAAAAAVREGAGLTASPAFVKVLGEIDTGAAMFMLINGNAAALQQSPLPFKMRAVFGSVDVDAELHGELRFRLADAESASAMVGLYQMSAAETRETPAGRFLDRVSVSAEGVDVVARFRFDQATLDAMIELARSM